MSTTVVSAPGKVLIAGGYLVLDQKYSGVVVSTSSRFYTLIQQTLGNPYTIWVRSPQFEEASWRYNVELVGQEEVNVSQIGIEASKNKFVHIALQQVFSLVREIKGIAHLQKYFERNGLEVVIVGHNDFYSQRNKLIELGLPPLISSLNKIPPFEYTGVKLNDVHKTGLGSSAALITSLVSALLVHFSVLDRLSFDKDGNEGRSLAHNVSQFIHCLAQGKVGSGFDVSSAAFGSQLYTRFNPSVIQDIMGDEQSHGLYSVLNPTNKAWDYHVRSFRLPPNVRLVLADVDAGSDTPSLVGKVLKWRQSSSDRAQVLWDNLSDVNNALSLQLLKLDELYRNDPATYVETVKRLFTLRASEWLDTSTDESGMSCAKAFLDVHLSAEEIRAKMREMGSLCDVPIEPPEQTELLNASINLPGVICGGVPGAGGYDAIWLLIYDHPDVRYEESPLSSVESLWMSWRKLNVSPLSATESHTQGLRLEHLEDVPGLPNLLKAN